MYLVAPFSQRILHGWPAFSTESSSSRSGQRIFGEADRPAEHRGRGTVGTGSPSWVVEKAVCEEPLQFHPWTIFRPSIHQETLQIDRPGFGAPLGFRANSRSLGKLRYMGEQGSWSVAANRSTS